MPTQPLDYSNFEPQKTNNVIWGTFKCSPTVWRSERHIDEVTARGKLLSTQLRRLVATSQPLTILAARHNTFYLLTEWWDWGQDDQAMSALTLLDNLMDLTISDTDAINQIRNYYITNRREGNDFSSLLNQILLKIVVTPHEVFAAFVDECMTPAVQQHYITALYNRQNTLILFLAKENAKFTQFFKSSAAEEYTNCYYEELKKFLISDNRPIFDNYSADEITRVFLNQRKKLTDNGIYLGKSCEEEVETGYESMSNGVQQPRTTLRLQLPSHNNSPIPWADATPRTETASPLSISSMVSRLGYFQSRSSSRLSSSSGNLSPSAYLFSPVVSLYKEMRGSNVKIAITNEPDHTPKSPTENIADENIDNSLNDICINGLSF